MGEGEMIEKECVKMMMYERKRGNEKVVFFSFKNFKFLGSLKTY